jgi:membrane protein implicated in regulation of membrane protease activity
MSNVRAHVKRLLPLSLAGAVMPSYAVDGAGLGLADIAGMLIMLFAAALPIILFLAFALVIALVVRAVFRSSKPQVVPDNLAPTVSPTALSREDIEVMQRWNIQFNGTLFRVGDSCYERLVEAVSAARQAGRDVP